MRYLMNEDRVHNWSNIFRRQYTGLSAGCARAIAIAESDHHTGTGRGASMSARELAGALVDEFPQELCGVTEYLAQRRA